MASLNGIRNTLTSIKLKIKNRIRLGFAGYSQLFFYSLLFSYPSFSYASPAGDNVVGGNGHVHYNGNVTDIHQISSRLAIDWASYNVGANETVNYEQLTTDIALNRILSTGGSEILGRINAQGTVILVNPNGIFFGGGSQVNVGGLIASGLDISSTDFLNGNYAFKALEGTSGLVEIENGSILRASLGGSITLLGRQVINNGLISANLGTVNLAAGKEAILTFDNAGLIGVKVTQEVLQNELGVDAAIINNGTIEAKSGRILLTASQSQDIFSRAVNSSGIEQATSVVVNADGSFTLGGGADVVNTGTLTVSANTVSTDAGQIVVLGENVTSSGAINADAVNGNGGNIELHANDMTLLTENSQTSARADITGDGGKIKVLGDKVGVLEQSVVDASGMNGGEVLIGGDYRGKNQQIRNASGTYVGRNTLINAGAKTIGNGGRIIVWGNDSAKVFGSLFAQGGSEFGNGGFVETSAAYVELDPDVSVGAANGEAGLWLIDPYNINIENINCNGQCVPTVISSGNGFDAIFQPDAADSVLTINALIAAFDADVSASVLVETAVGGATEVAGGGNITLSDNLNLSDVARNDETYTLTLRADSDININARIRDDNGNDDKINLNLEANRNNIDGGDVNINGLIDTEGGTFSASGDNITIASGQTISTQGNTANLTVNTNGTITNNGTINTNGGTFTAQGAALSTGVSYTSTAGQAPSISTNGGDIDIDVTAGVTILGTANAGSGTFDANGTIFESGAGSIIADTIDLDGITGTINLGLATAATLNAINNTGITQTNTATGVRISGLSTLSSTGVITLNDSGNNFGNVMVINATDVTLADSGAIRLGSANATDIFTTTGFLTVNAGGSITDTSLLDVTGVATLRSTGFNSDIILNNSPHTFRDTINLATAGNGRGDITINNSAATTTLGAVTANGRITVDVQGDLTLSGALLSRNTNSGTATSNIAFGTDGAAGRIFTLNSGASITANADTGEITNINVNGNNSGSIFNFDAGSSIATTGTGTRTVNINGGTGADTFNINATLAAIINAGDGNDIFDLNSNAITVTDLRGDGGVDILNGSNGNNAWSVSGLDAGAVNATSFQSIETLVGGTATDTLTGPGGGAVTWDIGAGTGNLAQAGNDLLTNDFTGFENYTGGDSNDTFIIRASGTFGVIDGGGQPVRDTLDTSNLVGNTVTLGGTNVINIEQVIGNNIDSTLVGTDAGQSWDITGINDGKVDGIEFVDFFNITGGSGDDTFLFQPAGDIVGVIDAGLGTDTIDFSNLDIVDITLGGADTFNSVIAAETIRGNNTNSTLRANNTNDPLLDNTWTITNNNDGTVTDANGSINFEDFNNLVGNAADDDFTFEAAGVITGTIDGGASTAIDTVNMAQVANVNVTIGVDIIGIEQITGNNTNSTLRIQNGTNTWNITSENDGNVAVAGVNFIDFNNLTGGTGNDDFVFAAGGSLTGLIDGGNAAATDTIDGSARGVFNIALGTGFINIDQITGNNTNSTLTGFDSGGTWNITNANTGNVSGINFIGFTDLNGGTGNDTFIFSPTGSISGVINGGTIGFDVVDGSALPVFDINLNTNMIDIELFIGNGGSGFSVGNGTNAWTISGANSGDVNGVQFNNFANLTGGTGVDDFVYESGGSISGLIDGGLGVSVDTLDGSVLSDFDVTLGTGIANIEQITGNNSSSTFTALVGDNTWNITGNNRGNIGAITFIDFVNLNGGVGNDDFIFATNTSISGVINGGGGTGFDTVNGSALANFDVTLNTNMLDIERFIGNNTSSTFTVADGTNIWNITAANDGRVAGVEFVNFFNLTGGTGNDDFVFVTGSSIGGLIDGGNAAAFDTINGSALAVFNIALGAANTGFINIDQLIGNDVNSTLSSATVADSTWNITGANGGTLAGIDFSGFTSLVGGVGDDTFVFFDGGSIAGTIAGGGQTTADVFNYSNITTPLNISLSSFFTNTSGIEQIIGNNAAVSTLTGQAEAGLTNWSITGVNDGTYVNGTDTVLFVNFNNLTGNTGTDNFVLTGSGAINGLIDGGAGADTYDASALTGAVVVAIDEDVIRVETITGNNNVNSTLIASSTTNNIWRITDANDGSITIVGDSSPSVNFVDFNNITGGLLNDTFTFNDIDINASIGGVVDGGDGVGIDVVFFNLSNFVLDLGNPTTTITNIEFVVGNNVDGTIIGEDIANTWTIRNQNDGLITNANTTITYIDFTNISGGDLNDDFIFTSGASVDGQIDGGGGFNTIDYSALDTVSVNVNPTAANGITNIDTIIGNDTNSTINATVNTNAWLITGNNDGTINGINFTNFNVLNGSATVDVFNVSVTGSMGNQVAPDTDLISGLYGLGGNDIFNVALDGSNNGSIKINGGADNDNLFLTGGNLNYTETYESNVTGGYDRLSYTQAPNNMDVNFSGVEIVQDAVAVSLLTVNGTTADDVVLLNASASNNFQLNANTLVSYTGKDSLTIDALGGTNDLIDILGDINITGTLSLGSETVTNSTSSLITADTLVLNSVVNAGILGTEIRTNINNLRLAAVSGDVFIEESADINISEMSTSGLLELRALTGNITDSGDLVSTGIVNLFADNGSILLDNNNQLSGELSFDAQAGDVTLVNGATQLNTVTTQNLNIAANADITDVATAVITTGTTTLSASGQNIVLDSATSAYNDITVTDTANLTLIDSNVGGLIISNVAVANNADITSNGNLNINTVSAGNTASLTTTGAILDSNDTDTNVTASVLQISSVTGIGEADSFETQVRTMDIVNTGSGFIDLVQTGVVDLVALQNLGVSGDITFESDADINLNQNSVVANQNGTGVLFMNTLRGSYLGLGEADVTNPDITARNATFFGLAGTFGTFQRPITLDVPQDGSVLIATRASFDPQFAPPRPDDVVTQGIDFTALGAISAAAGEQLVAVESLGDIDPAIFTDLQNYSVEETSIRMPRDQLFEDELDERERF